MDASRSRLVEAGSTESAFVLAGKGQEIAGEAVKALGLTVWADGRVMQGPEPEAKVEGLMANLPPEVEAMAEVEPPAPIFPPATRRSRKRL